MALRPGLGAEHSEQVRTKGAPRRPGLVAVEQPAAAGRRPGAVNLDALSPGAYRCGQVWGIHIEVAGTSGRARFNFSS